MSAILENIDENWFCPRCYRPNFSPEADEHCLHGCGYTLDNHVGMVLGWQCPKCDSKNTSEIFSIIYRCQKCQYKVDKINDIKFE